MQPLGVRIKVTSTQVQRRRRRSSTHAAPGKKDHRPRGKAPTAKGKKSGKAKESEITYHVLSRKPAWADEKGERYGFYNRYLRQPKKTPQRNLKKGKKPGGKMEDQHAKAMSAHRRWLRKKNKVADGPEEETTTMSNSADADETSPKRPKRQYKEGTGTAIVLYVGLGLIVLGLIMTFVGVGEDGFGTPELRLVGPSLIAMGIFFCLLRILFCACHGKCDKCCQRCPAWCRSADAQKSSENGETEGQLPSTSASTMTNAHAKMNACTKNNTETKNIAPGPPLVNNFSKDSYRDKGFPNNKEPVDNPAPVHRTTSTSSVDILQTETVLDLVQFINEVEGQVGTRLEARQRLQRNPPPKDDDFESFSDFEEVELNSSSHTKHRKPGAAGRTRTIKEGLLLDPVKLDT